MDEYPNDSKPCEMDLDNNLVNVEELSTSIEKIVITPDIYLLVRPSTDVLNKENVKYDDYNKITNSDIDFSSKHVCEETDFSSKQNNINMQQNPPLVVNKIENTTELKSDKFAYSNTNIYNSLENSKRNIYKENTTYFLAGTSQQYKIDLIKQDQRNYSSLILMYCPKCKAASTNYTDKNCQDCQTTLLFQCTNCTCVYKRLVSIQTHIKYECYKQPIFHCYECGYKTIRKSQLIKHIENEHFILLVSRSLYECSICQNKFKSEKSAIVHERSCAAEFMFQCKYCPFKTKFRHGLRIHKQRMHQEFCTDNYVKCPNCGKRYKKLHSLNRHIKNLCGQNPNFECEHCSYKVNRKYYLIEHMQVNHPHLFLEKKLYDFV